MDGFPERLRALMDERGIGGNELSRRMPCDAALISRYANGKQPPSPKMAARLDEVLNAGGELAALASRAVLSAVADGQANVGELEAIELARRCTVSDAGEAAVQPA